MHDADLFDLVHRRLPDFALRVQAGSHRPFVEKIEQCPRLFEANRDRVGNDVERELGLDAFGEKSIACVPRFTNSVTENFASFGIAADQFRLDHIDMAGNRP